MQNMQRGGAWELGLGTAGLGDIKYSLVSIKVIEVYGNPHNSQKYLFILTLESFLKNYVCICVFIIIIQCKSVVTKSVRHSWQPEHSSKYILIYFTRKKVSQVWNHRKVNKWFIKT